MADYAKVRFGQGMALSVLQLLHLLVPLFTLFSPLANIVPLASLAGQWRRTLTVDMLIDL